MDFFSAVGGWCSGDAISSVERYDPQTGEWRMVRQTSTIVYDFHKMEESYLIIRPRLHLCLNGGVELGLPS